MTDKKYSIQISFIIDNITSPNKQQAVANVMNKLHIPGHVISDLHIHAFENHVLEEAIPKEDEKYFVPEKIDMLKMAEDMFKQEDLRIKHGAPDPSEHLTDPDYYDFSDLGPIKEEMEDEDDGI